MKDYCPPEDQGLDVLYQDEYLIILNKMSGLLSVPGRGADKQDCLLSRLHAERPETLTIHRLDMATSGIIVFARDTETHRLLSQLFERRQVIKGYEAIVKGRIGEQGLINYALSADWPNRPRQKVDALGKPSLTHWQRLSIDKNNSSSRVYLRPETGRSHQLRVHLFAEQHPILGDPLYFLGDSAECAPRLMLHASEIEFIHPQTNKPIRVISKPEF